MNDVQSYVGSRKLRLSRVSRNAAKEAETIGPEAKQALDDARSSSEERVSVEADDFSDTDKFLIQLLGTMPRSIKLYNIPDASNVVKAFQRIVPYATTKRLEVDLTNSAKSLEVIGLTSHDSAGWFLTKEGYLLFDRSKEEG